MRPPSSDNGATGSPAGSSGAVPRVGVIGAAGRMGREVLKALAADPRFELVLAVDHQHVGESVHTFTEGQGPDVIIGGKVGIALDSTPCDAVVDFTNHNSAAQHAISAIQRKIPAVIGTVVWWQRRV